MDDWQKGGKISAEAREYGKTLCVEGAKSIDIVKRIESKIKELGGKTSFPVCFSFNHIAAHASPLPNDETVLKKGDLIKLDMGACINGKVTDTAITIEISSNKHSRLIEASKKALENAVEKVSPGVEIGEIGKTIEETIKKYGFKPIRNLSGHGVSEYIVHTSPTIPNFGNGDKTKLVKGQKIAIEPFATDGDGMVKEGKGSGIYALINKKPVRDPSARKVLLYIDKEFKTLPFHLRHLDFPDANFALRILERDGIIQQYPELVEKGNGLVSQHEHTIEVGKGVLTD